MPNYGERKREIFHQLACSPNGCNYWRQVYLKLETRVSFWVSDVGAWTQGFDPPDATFPGHKHEVGLEVE